MSAGINDGGPAFPFEKVENLGGGACRVHRGGGMSLRDHFAGLAMQTMAAGIWPDDNTRPEIAKRAYEMADAMLKARTV